VAGPFATTIDAIKVLFAVVVKEKFCVAVIALFRAKAVAPMGELWFTPW
jgi:hypothetical protein